MKEPAMRSMTRGLTSAALAFVLLAAPAQAEEQSFFTHLKADAPVTVNAGRIDYDRWMVRISAPRAGRWSLGVGIAISATDTVNVE